MPRTRVIHSRIDEETLLSAVEFYDTRGGSAQDPLSSKVATVLATLMLALREQGDIPTHDPSEVGALLDGYLQKSSQLRPVSISGPRELHRPRQDNVDFGGVSESSAAEYSSGPTDFEEGLSSALGEVSENPREALRALIASSVEAVTQPRAELDPDVWMPDPSELPDPGEFTFDVEKQPKTRTSDLPDDNPHVLEAIGQEDSTERWTQIIICQILDALTPLNEISEEVFQELSKKLRPHVKRYVKETK